MQVESSERELAIGYRSLLRIRNDDVAHVADHHVRRWLTEKLRSVAALDNWDGASDAAFNDHLSIRVTRADQSGRCLYRLRDENSGGIFEISVFVAAEPRGGGLLIIEGAAATDTESAVDRIATPRLVGNILDEVPVFDGNTRLYGSPRIVRSGETGEVADAIVDDRRTGSVIVACSPAPESDQAWQKVIGDLTRSSVGVAAIFVVCAAAIDELNQQLPPSHQIGIGAVRTFAPNVDLDDPADGILHRFLGPATLARSIVRGRVRGSLPAIHARSPRRRLLVRHLPSDARRAMDLLLTQERVRLDAAEVERRLAAPATVPVVVPSVAAQESPVPPAGPNLTALPRNGGGERGHWWRRCVGSSNAGWAARRSKLAMWTSSVSLSTAG